MSGGEGKGDQGYAGAFWDGVVMQIVGILENWNKWIYMDCDVSEVKVMKRKRRGIST